MNHCNYEIFRGKWRESDALQSNLLHEMMSLKLLTHRHRDLVLSFSRVLVADGAASYLMP